MTTERSSEHDDDGAIRAASAPQPGSGLGQLPSDVAPTGDSAGRGAPKDELGDLVPDFEPVDRDTDGNGNTDGGGTPDANGGGPPDVDPPGTFVDDLEPVEQAADDRDRGDDDDDDDRDDVRVGDDRDDDAAVSADDLGEVQVELPALYEPAPAYASDSDGTPPPAYDAPPAAAVDDPGVYQPGATVSAVEGEPGSADDPDAAPIGTSASGDGDDPGLLEQVADAIGEIFDEAKDVVT